MAVRIITKDYVFSHGHKPRQERFAGPGCWAFEIDGQEPPVFIIATYANALKEAKQQARRTVEVLP